MTPMALAGLGLPACWAVADGERARVGAYAEYPPPPSLADVVECSWVHVVGTAPCGATWHRVVPDDAISLAFTCERDARGRANDPHIAIIGPVRTPRRYPIVPGREMVAVKLRPEWSTVVIGAFAADHTDSYDAASLVLPRVAPDAEERLAATLDWREALRELWDVMVRLLARRADRLTSPDAAQRALQVLRRAPAGAPVDWTARALRISSRHLRRVVVDGVGASPSELRRTWRFLRALAAADACARPKWAAIAAQAGYADQAHLVREFRELAGETPDRLAAERRQE